MPLLAHHHLRCPSAARTIPPQPNFALTSAEGRGRAALRSLPPSLPARPARSCCLASHTRALPEDARPCPGPGSAASPPAGGGPAPPPLPRGGRGQPAAPSAGAPSAERRGTEQRGHAAPRPPRITAPAGRRGGRAGSGGFLAPQRRWGRRGRGGGGEGRLSSRRRRRSLAQNPASSKQPRRAGYVFGGLPPPPRCPRRDGGRGRGPGGCPGREDRAQGPFPVRDRCEAVRFDRLPRLGTEETGGMGPPVLPCEGLEPPQPHPPPTHPQARQGFASPNQASPWLLKKKKKN